MDATTMDVGRRARGGEAGADTALALVLVSCTAQPARVGELILVDASWGDELRVFGRGEARDDDDLPRVLLAQQRPGGSLATMAPLDDGYVSRKQLAIGWHVDGVRVENRGRNAMRVGDAKVTRAVVRAGETLEVDGQLLFLCVERPRRMAALVDLDELHAFGGPDAHGFVGESVAAWELRDRVAFVAPRAGHVLLAGPSGGGKELAAQAIHARSPRAAQPIVTRNAATLPAGLVDAELFGNVKNYPNPGMAERRGIVGEADGSTLFLDEIGELPAALQAHLLRVLDDGGEYQRLGDAQRRRADLRLVAATNRAIDELKHDFAARFRLRVKLPGLDERPEDVPLLARHLMRRVAARDADIAARFVDRGEPRIALDLMRALVEHHWTTHVRELDTLLWTSLASSKGERAELTDEVRDELGRANAAPAAHASTPAPKPRAAEISADAIRASLAKHAGVKDRVWRELGLPSRFALRRLMHKLAIADDD